MLLGKKVRFDEWLACRIKQCLLKRSESCYIRWTFTDKQGDIKMSDIWMEFGVPPLFIHHITVCSDLSGHLLTSALTYPEKHYHAEHGQQGRDHHTEEDGEFLWLPLMGRPLPGAARVLHQGLPQRRWPRLGFIDAGGEAVVEKRSPLCHNETCLFTSFTTSRSALNNVRGSCHSSCVNSTFIRVSSRKLAKRPANC